MQHRKNQIHTRTSATLATLRPTISGPRLAEEGRVTTDRAYLYALPLNFSAIFFPPAWPLFLASTS